MSREVRRVPKDWEHPKYQVERYRDGRLQMVEDYHPMFDEDFETAMDEWYAGWKAHKPEEHDGMPYWEYSGSPPDPEYYRPKWTDAERTHIMMYESTTEGTPISPAFETPEELARWLADHDASACASMTASYDQWLAMIRRGWAPSMMGYAGRIDSGVAFVASKDHVPT